MHEQILQRLVCCEKKCNIVNLLKQFWEQFWRIYSVCMDFAKKKKVELMAYKF